MDSLLYVGGIPTDVYLTLSSRLKSAYGFTGCIASLDIEGVQPNLMTEGSGDKDKLAKGCIG